MALLEQYTHHTTIALLEQALGNAETTSLLVKVCRLIVAAKSNLVAPSCLQGRVARGEPLPRVALALVASDEGSRKFRWLLASLTGMEGGLDGGGMPREVFREVLEFLMPSWDPLRRGPAGTGPQLQSYEGDGR